MKPPLVAIGRLPTQWATSVRLVVATGMAPWPARKPAGVVCLLLAPTTPPRFRRALPPSFIPPGGGLQQPECWRAVQGESCSALCTAEKRQVATFEPAILARSEPCEGCFGPANCCRQLLAPTRHPAPFHSPVQDAPFDVAIDCMGTRSASCCCSCLLVLLRAVVAGTVVQRHLGCAGCRVLQAGRATLLACALIRTTVRSGLRSWHTLLAFTRDYTPAPPSQPTCRRAAAGHAVGDQAQRPPVPHPQRELQGGRA